MFSTTGFAWALPMLFTILNEAGVYMNHIMIMGAIPYILSLGALFKIKMEPVACDKDVETSTKTPKNEQEVEEEETSLEDKV